MSTDFQTVVRSIRDLPPMPAVAVKVLELLGDPNVKYSKLGEAISADPAVSARLLKVSNSAFYSMKRQIKTLDHAIAIIGERTLRSLVMAASLEGMNKSYGLLESFSGRMPSAAPSVVGSWRGDSTRQILKKLFWPVYFAIWAKSS